MGNLGWYETGVKAVKTLGGPKQAVAKVGGGLIGVGVLLGVGLTRGIDALSGKIRDRMTPHPLRDKTFEVADEGDDGHGLTLHVGERYRVIEGDGDAILIELSNREDNPFLTSADFLRTVSDFPPIRE